jgi:hypothetical protein
VWHVSECVTRRPRCESEMQGRKGLTVGGPGSGWEGPAGLWRVRGTM